MKTKLSLILLTLSLTTTASGCTKETSLLVKISPSVKSCIDKWTAKNLNPGEDFRSGKLTVRFADGVTKIKVGDIIESYGLEAIDWPSRGFTFCKVKVLQGNREDYVSTLKEHPRIGSVQLVDESEDELLIRFYIPDFINLKLEEVESVIGEFSNLELVRDEAYKKPTKVWVVIKVPINSEFEWICRLQEDPNIDYVTLDYLLELLNNR